MDAGGPAQSLDTQAVGVLNVIPKEVAAPGRARLESRSSPIRGRASAACGRHPSENESVNDDLTG